MMLNILGQVEVEVTVCRTLKDTVTTARFRQYTVLQKEVHARLQT